MEFVLDNGKMVRAGEFNPAASWFDPGFSITEEMWFANGEIPLFETHYSRIAQIFSLFEREMDESLPPQPELLRLSKRLINKNRAFMGGWVILKIYNVAGTPGYSAHIHSYHERSLPSDTEGCLCLISPFSKHSASMGSQFPFSSEWIYRAEDYRMAGDRTILSVIVNEKGMVTETTSGNIFHILKNSLHTPSPETGCLIDLIRPQVLKAAQETGFLIIESDRIRPSDIYEAEEIFTVSEREGFKWVRGIESKRYLKSKSHLIWKQFKKMWQEEFS